MIRILILLITLNSLFTSMSIASACVPNDMKNTTSLMSIIDVDDSVDQQGIIQQNILYQDVQNQEAMHQAQTHCDNCISMSMTDMENMNCDTDCGISCSLSNMAITSSTLTLMTAVHYSKPTFRSMSFYTRTVSPELQPPLV